MGAFVCSFYVHHCVRLPLVSAGSMSCSLCANTECGSTSHKRCLSSSRKACHQHLCQSLLQAKGVLPVSSAFERLHASPSPIGVRRFSISCLLRSLRKFLFSSEQEKFTTGPPRPGHLSLLRSPNVFHRFMTAWTVTAVGFSPIPLSPVWRRGSMRSVETRRNWSWSTSWYVPLLPRDCSGAKMTVPGRPLQG